MKVIIQDITGKEFLGPDGRWVSAKDGARDFFTLVRAYNFAQNHTSVRFRVLLHCPEDGYSASIVEGTGTASTKRSEPVIVLDQPADPFQRSITLPKSFDAARVHLN